MTSTHRRAVGIFPDRPRTASALQALNDSGFAMKHVSVIARDPKRENPIAGVEVKGEKSNQADTGGTVGVAAGGVLGGVSGLLVGLGTLTIPGIGPAVLAGEITALFTTLIGGAAGAVTGGLVGALIGLGIPEHRAKRYRDRVASGDYLVILKDTEPEIARAERTLKAAGIEDWGVYLPPENDSNSDPEKKSPESIDQSADASSNDASSNEELEDQSASEPATEWDSKEKPDDEYTESSDSSSAPERSLDYRFSSEDAKQDVSSVSYMPHASQPIARATEPSSDRSSEEDQRAMGVFYEREQLEQAIAQLKQTGFPTHILSIMVRESASGSSQEQQSASSNPLSGATNLMLGLNHVELSEVGSTVIMGSDADDISAMTQDDSSHSAAEVLERLGIAEEAAHLYSRHLAAGDYLVTLKGHSQEALQAASTLGEYGMRDWGIYDVQKPLSV